MIKITLVNCSPKLEEQGIYMGQLNSYTKLYNAIYEVVAFDTMEYWYQEDMIKLFLPDETEVPDLSAFGEVESIDTY